MLIRCYPGYPMTVQQDGCRIYVAPRIEVYLRERSIWRQKLAKAHPDRGGSATRFARLHTQRAAWQAGHAAWFERFDLPLPSALRFAPPIQPTRPAAAPPGPPRSPSSVCARVQQLLEQRGQIGIQDAAAVLGVSNVIVSNALGTLRKRGVALVRSPPRGNNHRVVISLPCVGTTTESAA